MKALAKIALISSLALVACFGAGFNQYAVAQTNNQWIEQQRRMEEAAKRDREAAERRRQEAIEAERRRLAELERQRKQNR